jgi:magnesium-transporting ATPase (P-type)
MEKPQKTTCIADEKWHALKPEKIFEELFSSPEGIDNSEAEKRLVFYGENKLPEQKRVTLWSIIFHQLFNPLIMILVAAALVSVLIGEGKDAVFIVLVIIINGFLGTYQEFNAEKSAQGLRNLLKIKALVKRDQREREIDSEKLVPGDVVLLESGLKVPADMRLIEVSNLEIDESFLTGESVAASKNIHILNEDVGVSDRFNMAFAGSTVMSGRGKGIVVCTGKDTQVGRIALDVAESVSAKPPLLIRMERFTKQIAYIVVIMSIILSFILKFQGMDLTSIFFFVVALAVSTIPEGLPVALTVALSIATKRMSKRKVIVRRLNAVESLGSCTVIASDKTGTLTVNQQTARKLVLASGRSFSVSGEGYNSEGNITDDESQATVTHSDHDIVRQICFIGAMANEAQLFEENGKWEHQGDAVDVAFLALAGKLELDHNLLHTENKLLDKIAYESERKFSGAFYNENGKVLLAMKGAVEKVLDFCDTMAGDETIIPVDRQRIEQKSEELAGQGFRVLAVASGEYPHFEKKELYEDDNINGLTFYGLVCFIDPLRSEAKDSVEKCRKAGIKVVIITGDHPATALTIAQEIEIADQNTTVVTGQMLSEAGPTDSPAYEKLVASTTVFARVSPLQKKEIVDVLIREGEFVAVTGDGVNDAPALKHAHIGVAMGSGTDVAKEIGSMIIVDDNFSSIVAGVEEGRFAYDNVRKVIYLLISTGAAEVILFMFSIFAGLPLPLLAVQLLWLNLVTNGIQDVALAFEGGEPGAMLKKPRKPGEKIFNGLMIKQTFTSGMTIGLIASALWFWLNNYTDVEEFTARNMILMLMVFMQNFHALNCRSESSSIFRIPFSRNYVLVFGILIAQGIHILSLQLPFMQEILRVEPISFQYWIQILLLAVPVIIVLEIFKFISKKTAMYSSP